MPGFYHLTDKQPFIVSILILAGISLAGCSVNQQHKISLPNQSVNLESVSVKKEVGDVVPIPIPGKLPCQRIYRGEIVSLQQKLAEKDELIRSLSVRGQEQAQALQETTSEISRTKSTLHRLATQPDAASKIAEVEVAINAVKQTSLNKADFALQLLAQRLLDIAMVAYQKADYTTAMNRAAQSGRLIDAIMNPARKSVDVQDVTVVFRVPIPMFATHTTNLQADPDHDSKIIILLKRNTPLTAIAYNNSWLRVQTEDDISGWVQSRSVDIQINSQGF